MHNSICSSNHYYHTIAVTCLSCLYVQRMWQILAAAVECTAPSQEDRGCVLQVMALLTCSVAPQSITPGLPGCGTMLRFNGHVMPWLANSVMTQLAQSDTKYSANQLQYHYIKLHVTQASCGHNIAKRATTHSVLVPL